MGYTRMLYEHLDRDADMTAGCVDFEEKPDAPRPILARDGTALGSMGIYVFDSEFLYDELEDDAADEDSGHDLIPKLIANGSRVYAHRLQDSCAQLTDGRPCCRKRFHVTDKGVTLITPAMLGQALQHLH